MIKPPGSQLEPDSSGAFKPITSTPEALLSDDELSVHHAINSGGSGRGGSFWAGASKCGRRALLSERKYAHFRGIKSTLPLEKNHFLVGSVYHAMQEQWRLEVPTFPLNPQASYVNINVQEGARLFEGYKRNWDRDLWGKMLGVEKQLPSDSDVTSDVFMTFGAQLTGKVDMVVDLQERHLSMARVRLPDITPGKYIVDFKTAEMPGNGQGYLMGLQSIVYPLLWNWQFPDQPVKGTIFDVIYKRSRRKPVPLLRDDFGAYFAPYDHAKRDTYIATLKGMISQGKYTTENFIPNRAECCGWRGDICQFFKKECDVEV